MIKRVSLRTAKHINARKSSVPSFCIVSWWDYLMPLGMSARIDGLVSQLKKIGAEPEVITPVFYEGYAAFSKREANVVRTLNLRWLKSLKMLPKPIMKLLGSIAFSVFALMIISVRFLLEGRRNGLIVQYQDVFSASPAILARALFGITVIGDDIRLYFKRRRPPVSWVQRAYEIFIIKNTDFVITSYEVDYLLLKYMRRNKKVLFVPNGIKMDLIKYEVARDPNSIIFVGHFGNVDNVKALDDIMYIAGKLEKMSDVKIYVVGGPTETVKQLAKKNGFKATKVNFLGRISQEQLDLLYRTTAIGILPYFGTSRHTSQRIKALEFLSNGLLLVASPRGVDGFVGLRDGRHYVLAKTREDMVNSLEEILLNYDYFTKVALAGRKYVFQNYSWDKVAEPYLKLIEHLKSIGFKESAPKVAEWAS